MSSPCLDLSSIKTWHYAVSEKDRAQTTAGGAKALYKAGTIKPETLVWCTGMGDWKAVKDIPGLQTWMETAPASATTTTTAATTTTTSTTPASETKADGTEEATGWHYLDSSQTQIGPISLADLNERIADGQITMETYGWHTGLTDWAPLSSIPELIPVFGNEWFYVDKAKARLGPVKWSDIVAKYRSFEINHTTLAWRQGLAEWKLLSEIPDFTGKLGVVADDAGNAASAAKTKKQVDEESKKRKREKQKAKKKAGKWVATEEHANVYVQGLPEDTNVEEAHEFFKKAGLIKEDAKTTWKIKLYEDSTGKKKGDALICYKLEPSVDLAIELLDGSHYRPGCVIQVQKAQFKMKGEKYVAPEKPKVDEKIAPAKKKAKHDKDLSWDEGEYEEESGSGLRIVILKHMFDPNEAQGDDSFYDELKAEIGVEVEKKAGPIEKLTVFNGNQEGAVAIKFKQASSAETCIKVFRGRFFGKRAIECDYFDGKTNYKVTESDEAAKQREDKWNKWLESGGEEGEKKPS